MDLPLYKISKETRSGLTTDDMVPSGVHEKAATGIEVIAGKVIKYLLTIKGSDVFAPGYGSTLLEYTQITRHNLPRLHMELLTEIRNCTAFIQEGRVPISLMRGNFSVFSC